MTIEPNLPDLDRVEQLARTPLPDPDRVLHVVRTDGWECVQDECDGIHHFYTKT